MNRQFIISPAFDRRDPNPSKNYSIHGCDMQFFVSNERGAVNFTLYTHWYLQRTIEEFRTDPKSSIVLDRYPFTYWQAPMPADIGYHSPIPLYEDQTAMKCDLLPGGKCYYDGSTLGAKKYFTILREQGSDGLWTALEAYHAELFGA